MKQEKFKPLTIADCSDEGYVSVMDDVRSAVMGNKNNLHMLVQELQSIREALNKYYSIRSDLNNDILRIQSQILYSSNMWFPVFFEEVEEIEE